MVPVLQVERPDPGAAQVSSLAGLPQEKHPGYLKLFNFSMGSNYDLSLGLQDAFRQFLKAGLNMQK